MEIITFSQENKQQVITRAKEVLEQGGLVLYPTETCYGAGVDATNPQAVERLLTYKSKRAQKPLSIAVADQKMAQEYVILNAAVQNIYQNFLPGPITVVSSGRQRVAPKVESVYQTLGVRLSSYPLVREIVAHLGVPITATSANASYKKTPYQVKDILENISQKQKDLVDLIIDAGKLPRRKPSMVIDTTLENLKVLRSGEIKEQDYHLLVSEKEEDTVALAQQLVSELATSYWGKELVIFLLQGDLGTGKTFFTRALLHAVGVQEDVMSPTFILCHEYRLPQARDKWIFHIDTYRMYSAEEMTDLDPKRLFQSGNVVLIEWSDKVRNYLKQNVTSAIFVDMRLEHFGENLRRILYRITKEL